MTVCHLCSEPLSSAVIVGTTGRHGDVFETRSCARCGLVQTTPLPSEDELSRYYATEYRKQFTRDPVRGPDGALHEWGSPEAESLMDQGAAAYAAEIVEALGLERTHGVLEIGCGDGRLAAALREHAYVEAIEADSAMANEASERGVPTWPVDLTHITHSDWHGEFSNQDAIVCVHVLEHFREPLTALSQMRSLLRPGGRVWLEVPNLAEPYGCLDTHYWQKPHLYNFTAHTLCLLLHRAGFDDIHIAEAGHVLYAHATSGEREAVAYDEALARFTAATGARVPTGAEVAAHLDDYRAAYAKKRRSGTAVRVLQAIRSGEYDVPAEVRDAVELLGEQSARAAQIATMAIRGACDLIGVLEAEIASADGYSGDDWLQGSRAGQAVMAARCSHTLGRMVNEWKLLEIS